MITEKAIHELVVDPEFKNLIRPLFKQEYLQLEQNLISDGCRDPLTTWHGVIIDGHNRYELCRKHQIPFSVEEMEFECKEEVIAWICANQLGRRNLTEETRKYLIGIQYESEKIVNSKKNALGINQYVGQDSTGSEERADSESLKRVVPTRVKTAMRIAEANHISHGTVEKYATYSRALDELGKKDKEIVSKILSGRYKISHNHVLELSKMAPSQIRQFCEQMENSQQPFVQYNQVRQTITQMNSVPRHAPQKPVKPSVKDMPQFDPDAEITGLTLTVPSWSSSLQRLKTKTDLSIVSSQAKGKLAEVLLDLHIQIKAMLEAIKEE